MTKYITDLRVSLNEAEERQLSEQGYKIINVDLNKGVRGNKIYLWYKRGNSGPVSRVQFSFTAKMTEGLSSAGYHKINKDLNAGTCGDHIYLWFYKGSSEYDVPIVELDVSTDDDGKRFKSGYERSACDLNRDAGGNMIYLWVKRETQTYVCNVDATEDFGKDYSNFKDGYIRVDEDTNRGAGGAYVFIWYRQTTDAQKAIRDLQISTNRDEYINFKNEGYQPVNMDLNEGTGGDSVFLWHDSPEEPKGGNPIKDITLIVGKEFIEPFKQAGVDVIEKSLNSGNRSKYDIYLCYYG